MSNSRELLETLNRVADQLGAKVVPAGGDGPAKWGEHQAPSTSPLGIAGLSVPLRIETPEGTVRVYISLPGEAANGPAAILGSLRRLIDLGLPVDVYAGGARSWRESSGNGWGADGGWGGQGGRSGEYGTRRYGRRWGRSW